MFRRWLLIVCSCALVLLTACGATSAGQDTAEENSISFFAMDTYMTIRAWSADDALLERAEDRVEELESQLSVTEADSEIGRLNRVGSADLSPETAALLERALALCERTGGRLDISVYPVVRAWGFTTEEYRVPAPEEIDALLQAVDYTQIERDGTQVRLPEGMEIDLGSVAKGYTGDQVVALLREAGVTSALLDLGGNIQVLGSKPDGSDWHIAIQDPAGDGVLGMVAVSDCAVITSGGYERYFTDEDGTLWWHIMDPATGYPARNGLISVTVVGEEGLTCDALSTALFVMGPEEAIACWRADRDFEMLLVTEEGELLLTPGLAAVFTPDESVADSWQVIGDG